MEILLYVNADTTLKIRKELQESSETSVFLAEKHRLDIKTVIRWRNAATTDDKRLGPKNQECDAKF